jgi:hypothetical protein
MRFSIRHVLLAAASVLAGSCTSSMELRGADPLLIETLPAPAEMVSDGDVLVRITASAPRDLDGLRIQLNGRDVSDGFRPAPADPLGRVRPSVIGLVSGMTLGDNSIEVRRGRREVGVLTIRNHDGSEPVFSGIRQSPFICGTREAGLGEPLDGDCSAEPIVTYLYMPVVDASDKAGGAAAFRPLNAQAPLPANVATTTTTQGHVVDFVVRHERGVINRAIYDIAFLHRPGDPLPDPWTNTEGWNRRLVYSFGGGCAAGYRQGPVQNAMNAEMLAMGYAVAVSSLNVFGTTCDDVISAESLMRVKEHFVETFGIPVFTIGNGGSGGSMQQHLITQNYPGLLDGLTPSVSYPDGLAVWSSSADCDLLANVVDAPGSGWTEEQKRAVGGFATWRVCGETWSGTDLEHSANCPRTFPQALAYDAAANPKGARCSTVDNMVNSFGADPDAGIAWRPLDNVGVQYGLVPFNDGVISADQFIDLNARIGGHDREGDRVASRTVADVEGLRSAYAKGRINTGGGGLGSVPIIDWRGYTDPTGDIHDSYRSFVTRARIAAANGGRAENQVILRAPSRAAREAAGLPPLPSPIDVIDLMDRWLTAIAKDATGDPRPVVIGRAKPSELVDACWTLEGEKVVEVASYDGGGLCNEMYPPFGDPRLAAGAPLTDDILKCQLKPVDPADYERPLTPDQLARIREIFPDGVCDYSRPGVEQRVVSETWVRY